MPGRYSPVMRVLGKLLLMMVSINIYGENTAPLPRPKKLLSEVKKDFDDAFIREVNVLINK